VGTRSSIIDQILPHLRFRRRRGRNRFRPAASAPKIQYSSRSIAQRGGFFSPPAGYPTNSRCLLIRTAEILVERYQYDRERHANASCRTRWRKVDVSLAVVRRWRKRNIASLDDTFFRAIRCRSFQQSPRRYHVSAMCWRMSSMSPSTKPMRQDDLTRFTIARIRRSRLPPLREFRHAKRSRARAFTTRPSRRGS